MNVAHVLSSFHVGGGERVALDLAGGQAAGGHAVTAVSLEQPADGPLARAFSDRGIAVERLGKRPGFDPTLILRLAALFRRRGVEVVHLHNRLPMIYGAPAGRLAGAVVVLTRHGPGASGAKEAWLLRGAARLLHAYVAVSPEIGVLERERGYCPPAKISVIENGIQVDKFDRAAERRQAARLAVGIPADAWVVGSVGRFAPEKDYPFLVRAAAPLLGPGARLLLVGDGPEMPAIRAQIDGRGVAPFVSLPGLRHDVPDLLAALDVFVLSSRMEGLPLVALEAMATGLPVVATAVGGLPNLIVEGENGFLVPSGDEVALGGRLAALRDDPALARAVGERARARTREQYSGERMVRRYLDLYGQLGRAA
ncbi:MAG TPA: glycosyltransferase [Polyangia bacterium]|nr:glycosyltransferase [Polyangia bacterium]